MAAATTAPAVACRSLALVADWWRSERCRRCRRLRYRDVEEGILVTNEAVQPTQEKTLHVVKVLGDFDSGVIAADRLQCVNTSYSPDGTCCHSRASNTGRIASPSFDCVKTTVTMWEMMCVHHVALGAAHPGHLTFVTFIDFFVTTLTYNQGK